MGAAGATVRGPVVVAGVRVVKRDDDEVVGGRGKKDEVGPGENTGGRTAC